MHLKTKRLTITSMLLAFNQILIVLSSVIETNTLFLLAGAAFLIGFAYRIGGVKLGIGFYVGSVLLSFILSPNKMYCLTYACMGIYIVVMECIRLVMWRIKEDKKRRYLFFVIKLLLFNIIFVPMLVFVPELMYSGKITGVILGFLFWGGQVVFYIFDRAYVYVQINGWNKLCEYFHLEL